MQAFDASSLIHAWDTYPIDQIPGLWRWMEREIKTQEFVVPEVAYDEIGHKLPDCATWLKDAGILRLSIEEEILLDSRRIKHILGVQEDNYNPKGVDENDLLIISCARYHGIRLISNEAVQHDRPKNMTKYKIPAVCALPDVAVPCINFIGLFKESEVVI